ncbi:TetR/AcrR family transcriptional regulator [Streptomyces sp. P6-2-1]|uniref:TetR/AcrR family transcriptional regulator n=1 Tax=Streptomyces sp. P6-2-1 TaxID=3422591 RepID=UPI003D36BDA9
MTTADQDRSGARDGACAPGYHERVKAENRARMIAAARDLFLAHGYDKTSLARIAKEAKVSTGTLFKWYPSKAALFAAVAAEQWQLDEQYAEAPAPGDPRHGLTRIGRDYACLLARPGTAALCRLVITELPRMPELAHSVGTGFALDRGPFYERLRDYLEAESRAGTLVLGAAGAAGAGERPASAVAEQFLGMICGQLLWPQLIRDDFVPPDPVHSAIVDEAVALVLARHLAASSPLAEPRA